MIVLPKSNSPTYGLVKVRRVWKAWYQQDRKVVWVSLDTADLATAQKLRDELHAKLLAEGARKANRPGRKTGSKGGYIYCTVRVPGFPVKSFTDYGKAQAYRDELLTATQQ